MISLYKDIVDVERTQRYLDAMESLGGTIKSAIENKPTDTLHKMAKDLREVLIYVNKLEGMVDDYKFSESVRMARMAVLDKHIAYLTKKVELLEKKL